jgi:hypothetical protein
MKTKNTKRTGASPQTERPEPAIPSAGSPLPKTAKVGKDKKAPTASAKSKEPAGKKMSALDAAAQILAGSKEPLTCPELIEKMQAEGLWTTTSGKTPVATLNASLHRELKLKGDASRFAKAERGKFKFATTPK